VLTALITVGLLALSLGLVLGYSSVRFRVEGDPVADRIESLLPQTQCGQCGFAGCRSYAQAIAAGQADINRCPPGGENVIATLADLLGRDPTPLDPERGVAKPQMVAVIDEPWCIGCTLCIQACPVDAIVGANKLVHTVLAAECTGCELCVAPCPVDCIHMQPLPQDIACWRWPSPREAA
jgi:electron transport complex protein RnfB